MDIEFWVDPLCPWCWVTARWITEEVRPERDLTIAWQPISLHIKNSYEPDSPGYNRTRRTLQLLRIMESVRKAEGDAAVEALYFEFAGRVHYDGDTFFDPAEALARTGTDPSHLVAFDDDAWDDEIRRRMDEGLALAGNDIGTPIIGFTNDDGDRVGYFGPVITRVPDRQRSVRLWDGLTTLATAPGFWELKRTRTERPEVGTRP